MIKVFARGPGQAEILIYDPIGGGMFGDGVTAQRFVNDLAGLGDVKDITVRINSPGGEVFDGFAIFNALKNHPAQVHVQIDGLAASIASVIAMAGDLITMGDGAMMMIHDPWSIALGDSEDMRAAAEMLDKVKVGIVDAYAGRTGMDRAEIDSLMTAETWFTADEAISAGFADERIRQPEPAPSDAATKRAEWIACMASYQNVPAYFKSFFQPPQTPAVLPQSAAAGATTSKEVKTVTTQAPASVQDADKIAQDASKAAMAQETARRADIRNAFGRYSNEHRTILDECLDDVNCTVQAAQKKLLDKLGEGAAPLKPPGDGGVTPVTDGRDKFRIGASQALLARSGIEKREAANEFNGMTLAALAGHALTMAGVNVRGMSPDQIARKVLASLSTSDFPLLLANTAGKMLRTAYDRFPSTWQLWCGNRSVSDFKQVKNIQMGAFDNLALIPEGGEYTYGTFVEDAESNQAKTKGKGLKLTRQTIVNDDLGGFNSNAQKLGTAAARSVNSDAYAIINTNAALSDAVALFHATHTNLAGAGAAISVATLSAGKLAMRKQKDKGLKEFLNIQPKTLLVPVALEDHAKEIVSSTTKDGQSNSNQPNVLRNFVEVVSDPKLDENSATAWYLAADPLVAELVQAVFLDGQQTPFIDDDIEWATDSLLFKVRLDYGFAAVDFRAGFKNAGA